MISNVVSNVFVLVHNIFRQLHTIFRQLIAYVGFFITSLGNIRFGTTLLEQITTIIY
jgi:hypothetical protein